MAVKEWPEPERFSPGFCRRLRARWGIHPASIAYRSTVGVHTFARWEAGKIELPLGARLLIWQTLRQLVAEMALRALVELDDVIPHARVRLDFDRAAAEFRAQGKRPPPPPAMAPPPSLPDIPQFLRRRG